MKILKNKSIKLSRQKIIKIVISILCVALIGGGFYMGFSVFQQIKDFDIKNLTATSTSRVLDANGNVIYKFGTAAGEYVKYDELPEVLVDAVVSAEDSRYFIHDGFDIPRIIKAFMTNITHRGTIAGGSTITQQLIKKTYYPDEERTIQRKLGEVILSIEATKQTSKKKVMELYLNKIYFGRSQQTIGIYSASHYYFDKNPQDLTLPEAALLAGAINSPYWYDPFTDLNKATNRRNTIINLMYQHGYITKEQCEATKKVPVANTLKSNPIAQNKDYASYVDRVVREVKEKTNYDPTKTNMTIYTYMDTDIQTRLDDISESNNYNYIRTNGTQVGSAVVSAKDGRIVGLLSARDYKNGLMDYAYRSYHQPGSSIKPILDYAPAFEYLYWSTGHTADDSDFSQGGWSPKNWDKQTHGDVSLEEALGNSWNLAAIHTFVTVEKEIGKNRLQNWLKNLGYTINDKVNKNGLNTSWAIGGWDDGVTPLQQAAAYATISNGGTYIEPHAVDKIVINTTGETVNIDKDAQANAKQAMSEATAFLIRQVMTDYVKSGNYSSYTSVGALDDDIGAKTGTTNDAKDKWFCAYNPDYAWATWNGGTEKGISLGNTNDAKKISEDIARLLHKKGVKNKYKTPDTVVEEKMVIGSYPYKSPSASTPSSMIRDAWFVKGHTPGEKDTKSYALEELSSFDAALTESKQIQVSFSAYNGQYEVEYIVTVEHNGQTVATQTLSSNTGTLSYHPSETGVYRITGYYKQKDGSMSSNKISKEITIQEEKPEENENTTQNGSTTTNGTNNNQTTNNNTNNNNTNTNNTTGTEQNNQNNGQTNGQQTTQQ